MSTENRAGRPRTSSPDTIAEAATELFLERGYEQTSIADITQRAGVGRSSFFNYFASKADVLWHGFDDRMAVVTSALAEDAVPVREALERWGDVAPDALALAIANARTMGLVGELEKERALRHARLTAVVADRLRRGGAEDPEAEITGSAYAAAVLATIWRWADAGAGRTAPAPSLAAALDIVETGGTRPVAARVRQLRLVVRADDFEDALRFYRDELGLVERESYQGEGGARVTILYAGEATLELSNPAQVELIDRVETDGGTSDRMRVAFEVDDTEAVAAYLATVGAAVEATARITPWRSLNARLRGPAGLQLTLFQELDDR